MTVPSVVADVDTGIDDALALVYLAHLHQQGRIELTVTTSAGNCTAQDAAANSAEVLRCCGVSLSTPIVPGASSPRELELTTTPETHGPNGLGYWTAHRNGKGGGGAESSNGQSAHEQWDGTARSAIAQWKRAKPDYLLVAGPATNVAYAVEHAPEILANCTVAFMAGAFDYPGNTTATAEWNAWVDPHALQFALENWPEGAKPSLICPLNQTEKVLLYPERLARWQEKLEQKALEHEVLGLKTPQLECELAHLLGEALRFYFEFHESVGVGYCAQIHDLAAAIVMLEKATYQSKVWAVAVETEGELRGTTAKRESAGTTDGGLVNIVEEFDPEAILREFEDVVLRTGL